MTFSITVNNIDLTHFFIKICMYTMGAILLLCIDDATVRLLRCVCLLLAITFGI